jgi:hypothetical protein
MIISYVDAHIQFRRGVRVGKRKVGKTYEQSRGRKREGTDDVACFECCAFSQEGEVAARKTRKR